MKHTLMAQSVIVLRQVLSFPGWATAIDEIYLGGKLLVDTIPEVVNGVEAKKPISFDLTPDENKMCRKAFEYVLGKNGIPAGEWTNDLLENLEFVKKPSKTP